MTEKQTHRLTVVSLLVAYIIQLGLAQVHASSNFKSTSSDKNTALYSDHYSLSNTYQDGDTLISMPDGEENYDAYDYQTGNGASYIDSDDEDLNTQGSGSGSGDSDDSHYDIRPDDTYDDNYDETYNNSEDMYDEDETEFYDVGEQDIFDEDVDDTVIPPEVDDSTDQSEDLDYDPDESEIIEIDTETVDLKTVTISEANKGFLDFSWLTQNEFWGEKYFIAALLGGAIVGFLIITIVIVFICHTVRKSDEGSYVIDKNIKYNEYPYNKGEETTPTREYFA